MLKLTALGLDLSAHIPDLSFHALVQVFKPGPTNDLKFSTEGRRQPQKLQWNIGEEA
jgi:hypothetical protein